jgi:hypothetical protein
MSPRNSYPFPVWSGLLDHRAKMGPAVWEFLWCLDKITGETNGMGWVLGKQPVKASQIARDLHESRETACDNLTRLEQHGYIIRVRTPYGFQIGVPKSRKFGIWRKRDVEKTPTLAPADVEKTTPLISTDGENSGQRCGEKPTRDVEKTPQTKKTKQETQQDKEKERGVPASPSPLTTRRNVVIETFSEETYLALLRFEEYRKKIRRPLTEHAIELILKKLGQLRAQGHDPVEVLEQSIMNGYQGIFPVRKERANGTKSFDERRSERSAQAIDKVLGRLAEAPSSVQRALPSTRK